MNRTSNDIGRNNSHIPSDRFDSDLSTELQFQDDNHLDMTKERNNTAKKKSKVPNLNLTA